VGCFISSYNSQFAIRLRFERRWFRSRIRYLARYCRSLAVGSWIRDRNGRGCAESDAVSQCNFANPDVWPLQFRYKFSQRPKAPFIAVSFSPRCDRDDADVPANSGRPLGMVSASAIFWRVSVFSMRPNARSTVLGSSCGWVSGFCVYHLLRTEIFPRRQSQLNTVL
jgi:hypothetical protein